MSADRDAIIAELAAHPGEGHRSIAARLRVSASSVDRACRLAREDTGAECAHGRRPIKPTTDAPKSSAAAPDAEADTAAAEYADHVAVDRLPDKNTISAAAAMTGHEKCAQCGWIQERPGGRGGRCERCGLLVVEPEPVDPALLWRCSFCHWKQLREAERCEHCGCPRGRQTPQ